MNIQVPAQFHRETMYSLISMVIGDDFTPKYSKIIFDLNALRFIRPAGVTVLSNLIQWLMKRDVEIGIDYPELMTWDSGKNNPIKYLDDSGFFEYYIKKPLFQKASLRSTTFPLRHVAYKEYYAWLENSFIPWLKDQLLLTYRDSLENIKVCLQEIFNNIADHSSEHIGCLFAQHYPARSQVVITASDFGVGIPTKIREKERDITDADALKLAIQEGYSTKTLPTNTGAGLDIIISNIVKNNKGNVYIHSNNGILSYLASGKQKIIAENCQGWYPGTLIELAINTTYFYDKTEEEVFSW